MTMWQIWLILAGLFIIIEAITVGFFFFWFSIGALIALVSSFFISDPFIQWCIFLASSSVLIVFTNPLIKKFRQTPSVKTNAYAVLDKTGKVTIDIDSEGSTGQVKINGVAWSAKSIDGKPISKGENIIVEEIDGVKLLVSKLNSTPFNKYSY